MTLTRSISLTKVLLMVFTIFALTGCSVKLISSYDEQTDKNVSALQRQVETFLFKLELIDGLPQCSYDKNSDFYLKSKVELSAIKVRAQAIPQNEITVQQVDLLFSNLTTLEMLHKLKDKKSKSSGKLKCLSPAELMPLRNAFNSSFTAILKLELAKKRGE